MGSHFWFIFGPILGSFLGPFGARFLAETQGKQRVLALSGAPKGLHFGSLFGSIFGPHFGSVFDGNPGISWKSMKNHGNLEGIEGK